MNWESALNDPQKRFNMDETSFCVNPKMGKVLTKRGAKNVYNMSMDNEKDCYTVLLGGIFIFLSMFCAKFPNYILFVLI